MVRLRTCFVSTAVLWLIGAAPALAAAPHKGAGKAAPTIVRVAPTRTPPDFTAMIGLIDKLFPPQPDPDPAQLALARTSAQAIWPDGAYGRALSGFIGGAVDRAMRLKSSDFEAFGGSKGSAKDGSASKDLSLYDSAIAKDPYFDQRVEAIRQALTDEMGKISAILDPRMREGLARAMARRFDAQQLTDLNKFFATPSGHAFAGQYLQLWVDPDIIRSVFSSMPEMMKLMPDVMQKVKEANDKFPKPSKPADEEKESKPTKKGEH